MGDVEQGEVVVLDELGQQVENAETDRDVEHGDRFVGDEHARLHGESPRDGNSLPLTAGELVGELVDHLGGRG